MTFTTWGQTATHSTTVSASPAPTTTSCTVANVGTFREGMAVYFDVSGTPERTFLTGITGNALTFSPALSGAPDSGGDAVSYHQPIFNDKLNESSLWQASTLADLTATDVTGMPDGTRCVVADKQSYRLDIGSSEYADGYYVIDPTTGSGRWIMELDLSDIAFAHLCPSIPEALPAVQATLDFSSISAGTVGTSTVTVDGAAAGDLVILGPPSAIEAGLIWCGFVSADDTVTIRLHNTTGSPVDPASGTWSVQVIKPNSLPSINRESLRIYELLLAEYYDSTTLETELGSTVSEVAFAMLCARTAERRRLLANSTIKTAIQGSATANSIMEGYEGTGY